MGKYTNLTAMFVNDGTQMANIGQILGAVRRKKYISQQRKTSQDLFARTKAFQDSRSSLAVGSNFSLWYCRNINVWYTVTGDRCMPPNDIISSTELSERN